jgi:hypothetical protein
MWIIKHRRSCLSLCLALLVTCGSLSHNASAQLVWHSRSPQISIGGEPVVVLQLPKSRNKSEPQFLEATVMPGRGMAVLQIIDPEAKYGLRLVTLSPQIKSIQVYAPLQKNFVALNRSSICLILTIRVGAAPTPAWCCCSLGSRWRGACDWNCSRRISR